MNKICWSTYDTALKNRGNIFVWFSEASIGDWLEVGPSGLMGAPRLYSDRAIEVANSVRFRFGLSLRATVGFLESLVEHLELGIPIPHASTLSRRLATLLVDLEPYDFTAGPEDAPLHLVVDSSGLKVFGEGEWKVRTHGPSKRRTWRKLHLMINEANGKILSAILTDNAHKDSEVLEDLLCQIDEKQIVVNKLSADGGYDANDCYASCELRGIEPLISPRRDAKLAVHGNTKAPPRLRDENLRQIRKLGRKGWKTASGYHRRSLAETGFFRFKHILSGCLASRTFERQASEAFLKCKALNAMPTPAALGFGSLATT